MVKWVLSLIIFRFLANMKISLYCRFSKIDKDFIFKIGHQVVNKSMETEREKKKYRYWSINENAKAKIQTSFVL